MTALVEIRHKLPPLKALTALRFFATLYVVAFHIDLGPWVGSVPLLRTFLASGHTGVTLFFVLSGFVLAYNYPRVLQAKDFWVARFARVYPIYFLSCCISALRPGTWHTPPPAASFVAAFVLLQAWWLPFSGHLNQNGWTLSVEAFFYFLFPFLLPWIGRLRVKSFVVLQALFLLIACAPLFASVLHQTFAAEQAAGFLVSRFPLTWLNTFIVGMYLGLRQQRAAVARRKRSPQKKTLGLAVAMCLVLLCTAVPAVAQPLWMIMVTYAYAFLIFVLANVDWKLLSNRFMQTAGEMSYGIYILQFPFASIFYAIWFRLVPSRTGARTALVALLLLSSYASLRWVETPVRLWVRRRWTHRPVATIPI